MSKFRVNKISASSLQTFYQCLQKYYFNYFTKENPVENREALNFGTAVHSALECIGQSLMKGASLNENIIAKAVDVFHKKAAKYRIENPELIVDGINFIQERITKHPPYPVIAVELDLGKLNCHTYRGTPLSGLVDTIFQTSNTSLLVVDYKTSRKAKTPLEAKDDIQLSMYDYLVSLVYPAADTIWLSLDYLRTGSIVTNRTPYERESFEKRLDSVWEAMGDLSMNDIKPTVNVYCPWCGYRHLCPAYKDLLDAKVEVKPTAIITTEEEFVDEWERLKTLERLLDYRKNELKSWVNQKVDDSNKNVFYNDNTTVNWSQSNKTSYDPKVIGPYIPLKELLELVYFNKKALENYIYSKRQDLKPLLDQSAVTNPMAPRLLMKSN